MHPTGEFFSAAIYDYEISSLTIGQAWGREVVYVAACQTGVPAACHKRRILQAHWLASRAEHATHL
jgi:hypothetical protein